MKLTGSKSTEKSTLTAAAVWLSAALLGAIGCNAGPSIDPELQAHQRELSKQTVSTETDELPARDGDDEEMTLEMAMAMAGRGAPPAPEEDQGAEDPTDDPEAPAPSEDDDPEAEPAPPPPPDEETGSNDSVRCGDGVVDSDEHCDIGIEEGEPGACPSECDNSDPCKPQRYLVLGCRTRCMPEEPPADCAD